MQKLFILVSVMVLLASLGAGPEVRSIVIEASGDTYLVADLAPPSQVQTSSGMTQAPPNPVMDQNFGQVAFLRVWYNAREPETERLLSLGLVKFDLAPLKGLEVESASLQAYGLRADLTQPARLVDAALVQDDWIENQVNYNSRPAWGTNATATNAVFGANRWYSWDVTAEVTAASASTSSAPAETVSFVLVLRASQEGQEEQVLFAAREAGQNIPRLIITYNYEFQMPWWAWVTGIGVAAVFAFTIGILVARRRRPVTPAPTEVT